MIFFVIILLVACGLLGLIILVQNPKVEVLQEMWRDSAISLWA